MGAVVLAASFASFASSPAARAEGLALDRLHVAPAGDRFLGMPSPYVAGQLDVHAMFLAEYAYNPLVLKQMGTGATVATPVAHQAVMHADVTLAIKDRFLINVDVPVVAIQGGDADKSALHTADFGDLRFGLRARLFGADGSPFQLGLGAYVWAPTGTGGYVSDHKVRAMPYLALGGIADRLVWSLAVGPEVRFAQVYLDSVKQGTSLDTDAGVAVMVGRSRAVQLGAELLTSFVVTHPEAHNINAEVLFHGRYRFMKRFEIGAGVGFGMGSGLGTPTVRPVVFFAYVPVSRPERPEIDDTQKSGSIRREPEKPPPGADPLRPELRFDVVGDEIVLSDDVPMDTGAAELDPGGAEMVRAVAEFLNAHPELLLVEVRGHADTDEELSNKEHLDHRRAHLVRQALISHGVEPARLTARGYGPSRHPASEPGHPKNRWVEFRILQQAPPPPAEAPREPREPRDKAR